MECEWQSCGFIYGDYEQFQKHVKEHNKDLKVINEGKEAGKLLSDSSNLFWRNKYEGINLVSRKSYCFHNN